MCFTVSSDFSNSTVSVPAFTKNDANNEPREPAPTIPVFIYVLPEYWCKFFPINNNGFN